MKKKISVIAASALVISSLTSCLNSKDMQVDYTETTNDIQTSISETTELVSDNTSLVSEDSQISETLETQQYVNPLSDYAIQDPNGYSSSAYAIISPIDSNVDIGYGFDNPYTIQKLRECIQDATGNIDNSSTLSDVKYFQYTTELSENYMSCKFSSDLAAKPCQYEAVRAVLCSLGLRFGIDEIPASYIQERFPRFYYDAMVYNKPTSSLIGNVYQLTDPIDIDSMVNLSDDLERDYQIFRSILAYNLTRSCYIYNNPYMTAPIEQVRDTSTGKNVLVPTESQAEELQQDINGILGCENVDIFIPESRESFYSSYGYYPEELIDQRWSGNTQEGFQEYFNALPSSEQVEIITLKPSDIVTMYTYTTSDDLYYVPDDYSGVYESATETEKGKGKSR